MTSSRPLHSVVVSLALALLLLPSPIGVPSSVVQAQNTPAAAVLGRAGWDAIRTGRIREAADVFQQAIAVDPRDATLFLGAGLAAHLLDRPAEERQYLEQALRLDPRLTGAALLLGQIAYRAGDLQTAIRTYEDALVVAPENAQLLTTLARWRREAALHDTLDRRLSDHFTVLFEGAVEQPLADRVLHILELAFWRVGMSLSAYPAETVTVILYTEQQFRDITRAPDWAAGSFDGTIRVPVRNALERPGELERVLAHELTHALVWSLAPRGVPTWLNEGLAVIFEGENLDWARRELQATRERFALADLHAPFSALTTEQAAVAYAESGLAVQALLNRIGGVGVTNLLTDLSAGVDFNAAFERRAPMSYSEFQTRWQGLAPSPPIDPR